MTLFVSKMSFSLQTKRVFSFFCCCSTGFVTLDGMVMFYKEFYVFQVLVQQD